MLITAVCPACGTQYKVQPSLRGVSMRCPNPQCRVAFTIPTEAPPPAEPRPTKPGNGQRTGSDGEVVPLVEAQAVEPSAASAKAAPSWKEPPPVRRKANPAPAAEEPTLPPASAKWEPPPVRRGPAVEEAPPASEVVEVEPESPLDELPEAPPPRKHTGLIVAGLLLVISILLGGGGVLLWKMMGRNEASMATEAEQTYKQGKYAQAKDMYGQLQQLFPSSEKLADYRFMQGLSDFRALARAPDADLNAVLDRLGAFLDENKQTAPLKDHAPELAESVGWLADAFAFRNAAPQDDGPLPLADRIGQAIAGLAVVNATVPSSELRTRIDADLGGVRQALAHFKVVRAAVARIEGAAKAPTPSEAVRNVRKQILKEKINLPDIDQQADVQAIQGRVYAQHISGVQYEEKPALLGAGASTVGLLATASAAPLLAASSLFPGREAKLFPKAHKDTIETRFIVDTLLSDPVDPAPTDDPIVLATARGILYALARGNGKIQWTVRVGVDMTALPVRVPAAEGVPERILVPSADDKALDGLDKTGKPLWRYQMGAECIGRPLVVGNVAYLASYDGNVHEIELAEGKLLGIYPLGQPLTVGGVRDPNTGLLYFPADDFCVYEIDPVQHRCVHVLYTGHPAGSLRSEPLIVSAPDDNGIDAEWLILNEAQGLRTTRLLAYRLPFSDDREATPASLNPPPEVPGWTWFPPLQNGEQMTIIGDTGVLGLFNIRQVRNLKDPLLFPALTGKLDLAPAEVENPGRAADKVRGRSEVVEVQGQDFWVLAGGALRRFFLELTPDAGPRLTPAQGWKPLDLGSPLHASQVEADPGRGGTTLVLATQPLTRQVCLATALDDQSGKVLWQRQLGMVSQTDPVELRRPGTDVPLLLVMDQGGGLFAFDPARYANLADGEWRDAGQLLFGALDDGPGAPPALLPGPDGHSVYEIASPGDGKHLVVRRVEAAANGLNKEERTISLSAPLAGTPAVTETMMVLPLADGVLGRLTLPLDARSVFAKGPNWRSHRAPPDAQARVTVLGPDQFLTSDGARGLTHWQWPLNDVWRVLPAGKEAPTLLRPEGGSLTADPIMLPEAKDVPRRICIADVSGAVSLLTVTGDGGLKPGKSWPLDGRITAGPYIETVNGATRIGCVVDENELVWIDPEKGGVLWKYRRKAGAALVGRPRLVGGMVAVADESGRIVGLKPETGETAGFDYQIRGSAAPTAAPAGFGPDRLFVSLTDGTILLPKVH